MRRSEKDDTYSASLNGRILRLRVRPDESLKNSQQSRRHRQMIGAHLFDNDPTEGVGDEDNWSARFLISNKGD